VHTQAQVTDRYRVVPRTLVFVRHGERLLLQRRCASAPVWAGLFNGVGGHVERGEDIVAAAAREVREETGLHVDGLRLVGVLHATDADGPDGVLVFVFTATAGTDVVEASAEGELAWVDPAAAPGLPLVPDLPTLLPLLRAESGAEVFVARTTPDGGVLAPAAPGGSSDGLSGSTAPT